MNTPAAACSGHPSSVSVYRKWYFGSTAKNSLRGLRAAPQPTPLPFEEIHEKNNHKAGPPSTSADGYSTYGTFTIPEGADGKKLYGTCSIFLGVDDWGSLEVKDSSGSVVAQVDLKENSQEAGDQGGHKYHTGTGGAQLPSGTYSWEVNQTNIDYKPASANVSICNYSIDVVPTEPGGKKKPDPCPCERDTCDNSGGTPHSLALVKDNALYCYSVDFNKNVTEIFDHDEMIVATYDYSPYGQVSSTGTVVQPVQWSSEMNDAEISLVYYNYRYYNPADGRWINRDPIAEEGGWNLYGSVRNVPMICTDCLGKDTLGELIYARYVINFLRGIGTVVPFPPKPAMIAQMRDSAGMQRTFEEALQQIIKEELENINNYTKKHRDRF